MSNGWEKFKPAPIEFLHGKMLELFHHFRKEKTDGLSVEIDGTEFTKIIANAKMLTYAEYPNERNARPKNEPEKVCYCGSLRVALEAFKKAEYEAVMNGEIALLPCCMFVDIQREYGAESDYKQKADDLHKRKIDLCDRVVVLNVGGYIGESTRSEINYALEIGKQVSYLEDAGL